MNSFFFKIILGLLILALLSQLNAFQENSPKKMELPAAINAKQVLAQQLVHQNQLDEAIKLYQSIQTECRTQNLHHVAVDLYEDLFTIIILKDDFTFEDKVNWIHTEQKKETSSRFLAIYYGALAHLYLYYEEVDSMLHYYSLAVDNYNQNQQYSSEAKLNVTIANEFYFLGDFQKAKEYIQLAEQLLLEKLIPTQQDLPDLYNTQTAIYTELGEYDKALKSNLKNIQLLEQDSHAYFLNLTYAYNNLATIYSSYLGDYDNALNYYKKALALVENKEQFIAEIAGFTYNIGATYMEQNKYEEAKLSFLTSLNILHKASELDEGMQEDYINNCHHLVDCYQHFSNLDSALYYAQQAELFNKTLSYRLATTYACFSDIYLNKKDLVKAQEYGLKSLQTALQMYGSTSEAVYNSYKILAKIAAAKQQFREALSNCQKALKTISIGFSDTENLSNPGLNNVLIKGKLLSILDLKMRYLEKLYLANDSSITSEDLFATAKLATKALEQMNRSIKSETSKLYWLNKEAVPLFEGAIGIALTIYNKTKDKTYLNEAFILSERSKSMLMTDALQEADASTFGGVPDSLVLREKELQKKLALAEKRRFDASAANELDILQEQDSVIFQCNHDVDALIHHFEQNYPKYFKLKYSNQIATIHNIQSILDDKTTFIEYFEGKENLYIFSISTQEASVQVVPKTSQYEYDIVEFQHVLVDLDMAVKNPSKVYNNFVKTAHLFYNNLLKNSLYPSSERLIIIPDGQLSYIPFEVLLPKAVPAINQTAEHANFGKLPYLIRDYKISYNYSGTLLYTQRLEKQDVVNGNILALAPSYKNTRCPDWRSVQEKSLRASLTELPGAQREISLLSWAYNGHFLFGEAANEKDFKQAAPEYGILHLAMHGLVDKSKPELSGLAMEEDKNKEEDNILYAYEIKQLELKAALVVLSACETGIGKYQRGEGVVSLGRGFMYAGVPSILMTLWKLNDFSSSVIMEQFYQNLSSGMEKDEAIQQAKLHYLGHSEGMISHPALWACFVHVGDYSVIKINKKHWTIYYVTAAIIGLLGLFWAYKRFQKNKKKLG